MSSSPGNLGGGLGGAVAQFYFCHQCNRTVTITPSPTNELLCPICNGGFIEESETPPPNPNPNPFLSFPAENFPGLPIVFSSNSGGGIGAGGIDDLSSFFGSPTSRSGGSNDFNPFAFLQNYFNTLRASGANIQFVIEGNPSGAGTDPMEFGHPANLGDYFVGPGLEQLIQQLAENDPNRYGTPPASKSAIDALPNIKMTKALLASDSSQCAVCKDSFEIHEEAKQMPCKHIYHKDCITPWLELHNSCPVCRYELPTDDPEYENRSRAAQQVGTGGGNSGFGLVGSGSGDGVGGGEGSQENPLMPQSVERRLRISLPWPFRAFGSPAETSNSGAAGNDGGNNNRESNSNSGSQAREEDLD
ncbi:unnamed protein product [Ilex paraguariensis]|uniref:RING-type E3 ubiquitin transferase n=1 Tax=Ilex paraguariensis TaxID=185542 RepID=A0ABC8UWZ4_9AQUA